MPDLHRTLVRQMQRAGIRAGQPADAEAIASLLERVSVSYGAADQDRYTLERALEVSSAEMYALHGRLSEERDRMRHTVACVDWGVLQIGADGVMLFVNPAGAALLGRTEEGLLGRRFADLVRLRPHGSTTPPVALRPERPASARALDGWVDPAGTEGFPAIWHVEPLPGGGMVVTFEDLRERLAAEAAVRAAELDLEVARAASRAKDNFLATMSHELRTPLNAILGYAEMAREEALDLGQPHLAEDMSKIRSSGAHLLGLINDVLDLSKIDAGKMTLRNSRIPLQGLVEQVRVAAAPLAAKNRNRVEVTLVGGGDFVADELRVRQCLLNLVGNACKFTSDGVIGVTVIGDTAEVRVAVSDSGIGMSDDQVARLFRRFEQADSDTTRRFGGTGLGLALTRELMVLMGGDVGVTSRMGVGSTFTLTFPRVAVAVQDGEPEPV